MLGVAFGLAFLSSFGLGVACVMVWAGAALLFRARGSLSSAATLAVLAAAVTGAVWAGASHAEALIGLPPGKFEGIARIEAGPYLTQNGQRFTIRGASTTDQSVCVYASVSPRPHIGDLVFLAGRVTLPADLPDVGRAAIDARDCAAQLQVDNLIIVEKGTGIGGALSRFRTDMSSFLMSAAPGDTGALLSGLVTGDDGGLSENARRAFLNSGTTHITAISGANFAVLILLLGVMASGSMRRSLWFIGLATTTIWLFALMVGLQPSALRAALLATAVLIGRWLGRIPDLLTLTLLLASLQILVRPQDFKTLAFQLSIAATIALIVVFDGSERIGHRSWPSAVVLCVVAAQLATLPVLAARIGTMSGSGLLANAMIGPLASAAFPLALAGGLVGLVVPWIGDVVLIPAVILGDAIVGIVSWIDEYIPGTVQLGEPVPGAVTTLAIACWATILGMSGDLRRMCRHGWTRVRNL